ncbi:MAG: peptidase S8 [Armatimonadetes bacterium Cent15-Ar3]|nr:MAG: peptidase S8 [Armatimonadetes bacterium Cent15-Ar3]
MQSKTLFSASLVVGLAAMGMAQSKFIGPINGPTFVPGEIIVKFRESTSAKSRLALTKRLGSMTAIPLAAPSLTATSADNTMLVRISGDVKTTVDDLKANGDIEYAEPNWVYRTQVVSNDTYYTNGNLWGMYGAATPLFKNQFGSNAAAAWNANKTGSATVYVGIIDEGVMFNHADLSANFWLNPYDPVDGVDNDGNGFKDDTRGWDFAANDNSVYDGTTDDHGTHVAGTIGGKGGNGAGVAGVVWNVKLISAKFLGASGGTTANAIKAIDYITDLKVRHGLNIVATNNSWGGGGFSQALSDAISRANNAGILFIAAAGNNGTNNDTIANYPSNYNLPNVIAVGALTSTGARASFSNYGKTQVDLFAPGNAIVSSVPGTGNTSSYASYSGTSMATPHVTGAAALYKSINPTATAAQIKAAIFAQATPTTSVSTLCVTGGRLNVGGF